MGDVPINPKADPYERVRVGLLVEIRRLEDDNLLDEDLMKDCPTPAKENHWANRIQLRTQIIGRLNELLK